MACDIEEICRKTYNANYGLQPFGDIVDIDPSTIEHYDILCAGFPCQPWSNIGKHKGLNDERGSMFEQVMKFVSINKPKVVILENVKGLLSHDGGKSFLKMIDKLSEQHYKSTYKVLACNDYGVPQMRKRLFVVSVLNDLIDVSKVFDFPTIETPDLATFIGKPFHKKVAYTIRCGGRCSPIDDKHNWDGYYYDTPKKEYRLTIADCLKLQGFPDDFTLLGTSSQKYRMLGNTIPTNLTHVVGRSVVNLLS
jgi:DNA (cytosine-5)-methyltransferase 1